MSNSFEWYDEPYSKMFADEFLADHENMVCGCEKCASILKEDLAREVDSLLRRCEEELNVAAGKPFEDDK